LLLLTHPHVYTLGRAGDEGNLLVPRESLAAEGVPVERVGRGGDITYHGFALNVTTDLSWFRRIHLCGLKGREATSIAEEAGTVPTMEAVREAVAAACNRHLEGFA